MRSCRYHCVRCALHFTSLEAFDRHIESPGQHVFPAHVEKLESGDGVCRIEVPPVPGPATLWSIVGAQGSFHGVLRA